MTTINFNATEVYKQSGLKGVYKALKINGITFKKEIIEFGLNSNNHANAEKSEFINHSKLQFHYYSRGVKSRKTGYNYNVVRGIKLILA